MPHLWNRVALDVGSVRCTREQPTKIDQLEENRSLAIGVCPWVHRATYAARTSTLRALLAELVLSAQGTTDVATCYQVKFGFIDVVHA